MSRLQSNFASPTAPRCPNLHRQRLMSSHVLVKHRATRTTWRRAGPRLARTHGIKRCYVSTAPCFPCGQFSQPLQSYEAPLIRGAQRSLPSADSIHRPCSQQWGDGSQQWGDGSQQWGDGSQQWGDGSQQWGDGYKLGVV